VFRGPEGDAALAFEIEEYDGIRGSVVAWVSIPSLPSTGGLAAFLDYGAPNTADAPTSDPTAVWDEAGYTGVWHLGEATGVDIHDSTSSPSHGISHGTLSAPGKIGGAQSLSASTYIDLGNNQRLNFDETTPFTYSCWVNVGAFVVTAHAG
jgi:hypothetical protein